MILLKVILNKGKKANKVRCMVMGYQGTLPYLIVNFISM
jgi:hypothetical protein